MSGHPAAESEEPEPGKEGEPEPGKEGEAEPGKEGEETPGEKPEATPKYKSQEEAEAAAAEGQRQITKFSMELQETKDLLLKALATRESKLEEKETPAVESAADFMKRTRKEALDAIEALDPDDEGHKDNVAGIQAKADEDILKHYQEESNSLAVQQKEKSEGMQAIVDQAGKAMKDAGLNPERGSEDSVLFWGLAQITPQQKDGAPVSMDDQIAHCINAVTKYKNDALDNYKTEEAKRQAEEIQDDQPLDRGVGGPLKKGEEKPGPTKPVTLGSVVDDVMESRVI